MDRFPYIRTLLNIRLDMLEEVKTIIDVGAYDGVYAGELGREYPSAKVHAIEPCEHLWKLITKNTSNNVILHKLAIHDTEGKIKLFQEKSIGVDKKPSQSNTIIKAESHGLNKEVEVISKPFSIFCKENKINDIDLLLINAEGAEYKMFFDKYSIEYILKCKIIDLSMHGKSNYFNSVEYAKKRYDINKCLKDSGYNLLFGDFIDSKENLAARHIRQVWTKGVR